MKTLIRKVSKKMFAVFTAIILALTTVGVNSVYVQADTINRIQWGYWVQWDHVQGDGYDFNCLEGYLANGTNVAYCVQPTVEIAVGNDVYAQTGSIDGISEAVRDKITRYAAFGYQSSSSRSDLSWYAATQLCIWAELDDNYSDAHRVGTYYDTSGRLGHHPDIDETALINSEIAQIRSDADNFTASPNFTIIDPEGNHVGTTGDNVTFNCAEFGTYTIVDNSNNLQFAHIIGNEFGNRASVGGNTARITITDADFRAHKLSFSGTKTAGYGNTHFLVASGNQGLLVNSSFSTTATSSITLQAGNDPLSIILTKEQADSATKDIASLAGAQFTIKYYDRQYNKSTLPANATRTWVIETQKNSFGTYIATLDDTHKVSGDDLYKTPMGNPTIPLGTITIQETKAPDGYSLDGSYTVSGSTSFTNSTLLFNYKIGSDGDAHGYDENGNIVNFMSATNGYTKQEGIFYGDIELQKNDSLYGTYSQGNAKIGTTSYSVTNVGTNTVYVDRNNNGSFSDDEAVVSGAKVMDITTDSTGHFKTPHHLSYGTYRITETSAPTGYTTNGNSSIDVKVYDKNGDGQPGDVIKATGVNGDYNFTDEVIRGGIKFQKNDSDYKYNYGQGDAIDLTSTYSITNKSSHAVNVNGTRYESGAVCYTFTTDSNGKFSSANNLLPYGNYELNEIKQPVGYTTKGTTKVSFTVKNDKELVDLTSRIYNEVIRGGIKFQKNDSEYKYNYGQGNALDLTSTYSITNKSSHAVSVNGTQYKSGAVCYTFTTDSGGKFSSANNLLPYGDYELNEVKQPVGYTTNGTTEVSFTVKNDKEMIDLTSSIYNEVIRGGVKFQKNDSEYKYNYGQGNAFDLTSTYSITNKSSHAVSVNGTRYESGAVCYTFTTDNEGKFSSANNLLPYGDYELNEVKQPAGYTAKGTTKVSFTVKNDKEMVDLTTNIYNNVIRGGFSLQKYDADTGHRTQGDTNDLKATYLLYNRSKHDVLYHGEVKHANDVIDTVTTDEKGYYTTNYCTLPYGTYELVEDVAPVGYSKTGKVSATFKITVDQEHVPVLYRNNDFNTKILDNSSVSNDLEDNVITGDFTIHKTYESRYNESSFTTPENGAKFVVVLAKYVTGTGENGEITRQDVIDAYNNADKWTGTDTLGDAIAGYSDKEFDLLTTDENGNATSKKLAYGKYKIAQLSSAYEELDTVTDVADFDVNTENQPTVSYEASNKISVYPTRIYKRDALTNEAITLNSADFKIYQLTDFLNNPVNRYITQKVGNSSYDTFRTTSTNGENQLSGNIFYAVDGQAGTLTAPLALDAGTYRIEEVNNDVDSNGTPAGYITNTDDTILKVSAHSINRVENSADGTKVMVTSKENERITGTLYVNKSILDYDADTSFIDRKDLSHYGFTLIADEDICNPATGEVITSKGDVAKDIYGHTVGNFYTDKDGKAVVSSLPLGKYTMTETDQPDGIVTNHTVYPVSLLQKTSGGVLGLFTHLDSNEDDYEKDKNNHPIVTENINIVNDTTKVAISKKAVTGDDELSGAKLTVTDENNAVVDSWISGTIDHSIEGLMVGHTYHLTEESAPSGYVKANTIDFKVNDDGTVQKVTMIDKVVSINKTDGNGTEVAGAKVTVSDTAGNIVDSWTSTDTAHNVTGLEEDKSYTWHEEYSKDVDGHYYAEDYTFEVTGANKDGIKLDQALEMKDCPIVYQISKKDENGNTVSGVTLKLIDETANQEVALPNDGITTEQPMVLDSKLVADHTYLLEETEIIAGVYKANSMEFTVPHTGTWETTNLTMYDANTHIAVAKTDTLGNNISGADLSIYETVKDKDGNIVAKTDADGNPISVYNFTSTKEYIDISDYVKGGDTYILHENEAPFGYNAAEDEIFTVTGDKEKNQCILMIDSSKPVYIRVAKSDAGNVSYYLKGAEITIYNESGKVAKTLDGKDAVGKTDENGQVQLQIAYEQGESYYAKETKAPDGYFINDAKFNVVVSDKYTFASTDLIAINVYDEAMSIVDSAVTTYIPVAIGLGVGFGVCLYFVLKKKKSIIK